MMCISNQRRRGAVRRFRYGQTSQDERQWQDSGTPSGSLGAAAFEIALTAGWPAVLRLRGSGTPPALAPAGLFHLAQPFEAGSSIYHFMPFLDRAEPQPSVGI